MGFDAHHRINWGGLWLFFLHLLVDRSSVRRNMGSCVDLCVPTVPASWVGSDIRGRGSAQLPSLQTPAPSLGVPTVLSDLLIYWNMLQNAGKHCAGPHLTELPIMVPAGSVLYKWGVCGSLSSTQCHFSNSICSLCVSASCFGDSCSIANFFICYGDLISDNDLLRAQIMVSF